MNAKRGSAYDVQQLIWTSCWIAAVYQTVGRRRPHTVGLLELQVTTTKQTSHAVVGDLINSVTWREFCVQVDSKSQPMQNKLSLKGAWSLHVTYFKFSLPTISLKRLKVDTSNFVLFEELWTLLGCIACTQCIDVAYYLLLMSYVACCVCLFVSVGHTCELYKNGWTDWDVGLVIDSCRPKEQ